MAIGSALEEVANSGNLPVPLHIRNAPTKLMAEMGYHEGYKYPHDYPGNYVKQQYLPDGLDGTRFWKAQENPQEIKMAERQKKLEE
jgi:putative ATPase